MKFLNERLYFGPLNTDVFYHGLNHLADVPQCLALVLQYLHLSAKVGTMGPILQVVYGGSL